MVKENKEMKLMITTDDGELIDIIEHVEDFDLDKSVARASLIEDIKEAIDSMEVQR